MQSTHSSRSWPADRIERRPIDGLIPYARNSRTHSDAQVAQIAASIREWGWTMPVLIDEQGGIIAGHGRVLAARKLGLPEVPCMIAAGWSDAQRRAYVIADNKLALNAGWDDDLLRLEMCEIEHEAFDLGLTGFSGDELTEVIAGAGAVPLDDLPSLPDGDKSPFQQMTFTLHDEQAKQVKEALKAAKEMGAFVDGPNENSNGNALARICEIFLDSHGDR